MWKGCNYFVSWDGNFVIAPLFTVADVGNRK